MNGFSFVFLAALAGSAATELWLARRQLRHVAAHRDAVPAPFAGQIPLADHRKAADYTRSGIRLEIAGILYHIAAILAWTLGGGIALVDGLGREAGYGLIVTGTGVILSVALINAALYLPLSAWRTFVIEQRYGFNHTRPLLFVTDLIRSAALSLLLGAPLVAAALGIMAPGDASAQAQADPFWWIQAWLLWLAFSLLMTWIYPVFIAPLFNRFSPLEDAALRSRIERLLERTGFASGGVFVMDGSRRSAHGNAWFSGLGRHKRIVFFDTLLDTLTPAEVEAVLAHELGHFRLRHIHKRMAASALVVPGALLLLDLLLTWDGFYAGLGVDEPSNHAALLLFAFAAPVFGFLLTPLSMRISRRHEYEADAFAAHESDARDLATALVKLHRDNASTLTPDPLYSAFHYSHPGAAERIARLGVRI